jgi:hypothetical protein
MLIFTTNTTARNETMIALFFIDILTETKGYYLKCDFTKQTIKYYEKNI